MRSYWRCSRRPECKSSAVTINKRLHEINAKDHSHSPNNAVIIDRVFLCNMRFRLKTENLQPSSIYKIEMAALRVCIPEHLHRLLVPFEQCRKSCRKFQNKIHTDFKLFYTPYQAIPWDLILANDNVETNDEHIRVGPDVLCTECGDVVSAGRQMYYHKQVCGVKYPVSYYYHQYLLKREEQRNKCEQFFYYKIVEHILA